MELLKNTSLNEIESFVSAQMQIEQPKNDISLQHLSTYKQVEDSAISSLRQFQEVAERSRQSFIKMREATNLGTSLVKV
jgi:hypothetical protein